MEMKAKEINGKKFSVMMLPPRRAAMAIIDVTAVFGPIMVKVMKSPAIKKASGKELSDDDIAGSLPELLAAVSSVDQEKLDRLITELSKVSILEGAGGGPLHVKFDEIFEGDLSSMFLWLWFAVEVNFGEFFRNALKGATEDSK